MSRPTREEWALELALVTAKRSTCLRRNVGCVLLDSAGKVLATGNNGVASGLPHCNHAINVGRCIGGHRHGQLIEVSPNKPIQLGLGESLEIHDGDNPHYPHACKGAYAPSGTMLDACEAIHAEQNALLQCPDVREIYACYVTTAPCVTCTKLLLNTGCRVIVYLDDYPHSDAARDLWHRAERIWVKHPGLKQAEGERSASETRS